MTKRSAFTPAITRAIAAVAAIVLLVPIAAAPGCASLADLAGFREEVSAKRDTAEARLDTLIARRDALPASDPRRESLDAAIALLSSNRDTMDTALRRIDELAASTDTPDPIAEAVGAVAPWLPEPVRTPALLLGGLGAALLRGTRLKQSAISIARSIEQAAERDPELRARLEAHRTEIEAAQTKSARRIAGAAADSERPKAAGLPR